MVRPIRQCDRLSIFFNAYCGHQAKGSRRSSNHPAEMTRKRLAASLKLTRENRSYGATKVWGLRNPAAASASVPWSRRFDLGALIGTELEKRMIVAVLQQMEARILVQITD